MGTGKQEAARKVRQGRVGDGSENVKAKGENFYRCASKIYSLDSDSADSATKSNAKKIKTLSMYKEGKAQRNATGKVTKPASYQSRQLPKARVEPNRKWFSNTRVISQTALESFRQAVAERASDPYQVLMKTNKLPMSLIRNAENTKDGVKQYQAKIAVESAPFGDTFGPKAQRKRVKLGVGSLEDFAGESVKMHDGYLDRLEEQRLISGQSEDQKEAVEQDGELTSAREPIFSKGQSKRIWNELYKVIEKYIREEAPHKHLVFVLNKCDLVPTSVAVSLSLFRLLLFCVLIASSSIAKSRLLSAMHFTSPWKTPVTALVY